MSRSFRQAGLTIIELMIALSILVLVVAIINVLWRFVSQNFEFSLTHYRLTENASRTVTTLTTELRQAEEAMNGAYPLATVEDNQLAYYADIDRNGSVERIRYFVLGTVLKRGVIDASGNPPNYPTSSEKVTTVVENLLTSDGPLFEYYNENWPDDQINNPLPLAQRLLDTRMIRVRIPISLNQSGQAKVYRAESIIQVRNLKQNL